MDAWKVLEDRVTADVFFSLMLYTAQCNANLISKSSNLQVPISECFAS